MLEHDGMTRLAHLCWYRIQRLQTSVQFVQSNIMLVDPQNVKRTNRNLQGLLFPGHENFPRTLPRKYHTQHQHKIKNLLGLQTSNRRINFTIYQSDYTPALRAWGNLQSQSTTIPMTDGAYIYAHNEYSYPSTPPYDHRVRSNNCRGIEHKWQHFIYCYVSTLSQHFQSNYG